MNILEAWGCKWFGFWKEYGPHYEECPSIYDFVFPEITATYNKAKLREYLTRAQVVASTSRRNFPSPFTGVRLGGAISTRTDGRWYWLDDLADYIDQYDVALPAAWLREIEANNYVPPAANPDVVESLERPPIKP